MLPLLALVGIGWHWLELVFTRLNMLIDIELVGVCWCSVNMTVIFHKILNPTANLSQLVCWRLSVRCELAFRRTIAHKQLVRLSPQGSSVDVRAQCSNCICTIKLLLVWLPEGRRTEGLLYDGLWCNRGHSRHITRSRVDKCFGHAGRNVKIGATERACRSQTLLREEIAKRKAVLIVRTRPEVSSMGSKGALQRASNTTAKSHVGTRDRTGGLSLSAPRMKRVTRGCLPTD